MTFSPAIISSLAPASITVSGGSATSIPTELVGVTFGIFQQYFHHSGNVYPTLVVVPGADRRIRLSIPFNIAITQFGLALTKITALSVFLTKFSDFNRQSGSVHDMISLTTNCLAAAQISGWSVNVDGILMADVDVLFVSSDGVTDPITMTENQALPALSGNPQLHTLGPVSINGAIIPGLTSSGGRIGSTPTLLRTDGDYFGRTAARITADPVINLSHADPRTLIDAISDLGTNITANVVVYFRDYNNTTGENEQANGMSITVAAGRVHPHGPDENQGVVATSGIDVFGISSDGAGNPFVVATGVSVPTPP